MKIPFEKLIDESGENLTKRKLAKEMHEAGFYKSIQAAQNAIGLLDRGLLKDFNKAWAILRWLCERFNKKPSEIIQM